MSCLKEIWMILPEEQQEELQGLFFIMNINNRNFKRNYYKSPQITQIYTDMKFNAKVRCSYNCWRWSSFIPKGAF
jgi:hypothetical protein